MDNALKMGCILRIFPGAPLHCAAIANFAVGLVRQCYGYRCCQTLHGKISMFTERLNSNIRSSLEACFCVGQEQHALSWFK